MDVRGGGDPIDFRGGGAGCVIGVRGGGDPIGIRAGGGATNIF